MFSLKKIIWISAALCVLFGHTSRAESVDFDAQASYNVTLEYDVEADLVQEGVEAAFWADPFVVDTNGPPGYEGSNPPPYYTSAHAEAALAFRSNVQNKYEEVRPQWNPKPEDLGFIPPELAAASDTNNLTVYSDYLGSDSEALENTGYFHIFNDTQQDFEDNPNEPVVFKTPTRANPASAQVLEQNSIRTGASESWFSPPTPEELLEMFDVENIPDSSLNVRQFFIRVLQGLSQMLNKMKSKLGYVRGFLTFILSMRLGWLVWLYLRTVGITFWELCVAAVTGDHSGPPPSTPGITYKDFDN